jgi:hypothetical protein
LFREHPSSWQVNSCFSLCCTSFTVCLKSSRCTCRITHPAVLRILYAFILPREIICRMLLTEYSSVLKGQRSHICYFTQYGFMYNLLSAAIVYLVTFYCQSKIADDRHFNCTCHCVHCAYHEPLMRTNYLVNLPLYKYHV